MNRNSRVPIPSIQRAALGLRLLITSSPHKAANAGISSFSIFTNLIGE